MHKLILLFFALVAIYSRIALAQNHLICLKPVEISIEKLNPPIYFSTGPKRKDKIELRMPADCKNGEILRPSSFPEAVNWLDLALPLDFKKGMTGGPYLNPYMYTSYGSSVEDQLYEYFTREWQLKPNGALCKEAPANPAIEPGGNTCFYQLIYYLRELYRRPSVVIREHKG